MVVRQGALDIRAGLLRRRALTVTAVMAAAAVTSVAVMADRFVLLAAAIGVLAAVAIGVANWRWSIYGLVLFMPFSGIPIILSYPHTELAVLIKDIVFLIPAYIGFILARKGRGWSFPGAPLVPLLVLVVLVLVQTIPQLAHPLVPLIGIKVWLLYIPLLFVGYHFIEHHTQLSRLLALMALAGMPPLMIGIAEAALITSGRSDLVYSFYGPAASAVTQNFADVGYSSGVRLLRVPSTFSFVAQYYDFASAMVAVNFALWRLTRRLVGAIPLGVALIASLTSGSRSAFVLTPLLVVLMVVFDRKPGNAVAVGSGLCVGAATIGSVLGLSAMDALGNSIHVGSAEVQSGFITGVPTALHLTQVGFGTGQATGAGRYALDGARVDYTYDPSFSESWWVKAVLELGVAGLVALLLLISSIIRLAYKGRRRLVDPGLRGVAAAFIALLLWALVYSTKGAEIDIDPLNVYFWLFAGILLRLPSLPSSTTNGDAGPLRGKRRHISPPLGEEASDEPVRVVGAADRLREAIVSNTICN